MFCLLRIVWLSVEQFSSSWPSCHEKDLGSLHRSTFSQQYDARRSSLYWPSSLFSTCMQPALLYGRINIQGMLAIYTVSPQQWRPSLVSDKQGHLLGAAACKSCSETTSTCLLSMPANDMSGKLSGEYLQIWSMYEF